MALVKLADPFTFLCEMPRCLLYETERHEL